VSNAKQAMWRAQANMETAARAASARPLPVVPKYDHSYEDGVETISKALAPTSRIIEGIASTPTVNMHGYSLSSKGCMVRLPCPVLFGHGHVGKTREKASGDTAAMKIGEVFYVRKSAESILVRAQIDSSEAGNYAWQLIQSGEARCFSGAADNKTLRIRGVVDGHTFYDAWELLEVSVCRKGANPDCTFQVIEA
jgi:hypothetical protein